MSTQFKIDRLRRFLHRNGPLQLVLVLAFWLAGQVLVMLTRIPVPGGVVGMLVVLLLLATKHLSILSVRRGAEWLIRDMVLFFVPAALAVLDHRELMGIVGLKVFAVIVCSTLVVMCVTGLTVDLSCRRP
ncbi:CidA/LrgA family protein [Bradyrhizobium sp. PMVTL-01]|uniref:CidA/LrgA family protein n=1 Tax=Bradyrhizobium sp. PMVTL-01 TaxID=3434999 RepID=UPI003F724889